MAITPRPVVGDAKRWKAMSHPLRREMLRHLGQHGPATSTTIAEALGENTDRKSTRLNSSHLVISYAVFCLKKKCGCCTVRHSGSSCSIRARDSVHRRSAPCGDASRVGANREPRSSASPVIVCFFFNDTATTEIYTLSLHDALPIYELHWSPHRGEWRYLENFGVIKVKDALILVFLEERFEHRAGLRAILGEHVALAHVFSAFFAREWRLVKGDVGDKVELLDLLADFLGQQVERQLLLLQLLDNCLFAFGGGPALQELV